MPRILRKAATTRRPRRPATPYVAFLRAINVGGHVVTMDKLKTVFRSLGFDNVETFIASGNVIFESDKAADAALERRIATALEKTLGYEVATFVRSLDEIAAIAAHQPFPTAAHATARTFCVGFLAEPLTAEGERLLMAMKTEVDDFRVRGREVYWLCKTGQAESMFTNAGFEKRTKTRATYRNMNTVKRLHAKYPPRSS